jgi:glycine cleavage system H protein
MMGTYAANFPTDRFFSSNHLWLKPIETNRFRVGLTAFSIRLLKDVYFLEWSAGVDFPVAHKQEIGQIESSKAVSGLYSPADGQIVAFNEGVLDDPSLINSDGYESGWLFEFATPALFLSAEEYVTSLEKAWQDAQRSIKKQIS